MADFVGKTLGRYRVVARLGRGGMAEVYKAFQPGLDRYVGIKVLHGHLVDDEDFIGRFEREALAIGKLRHQNIVQALDFDREGEQYFMVMEYIDGPTLKDELKARQAAGKPFTLAEVGRIFTALCSALDYAHARGMVHRDIKPANVMINQEGHIVLTDFGIARIIGATQFTQTGALAGTPAYMSPEQGEGKRADTRSDIYSLGVMLYEMVTGSVPYDADTPFAVILKHISEPLPLPSKINPDLPEAVEQVILKAMSKEPDDRYQTAGEMAQALRQAVGLVPGDTLQNHPISIVASPPQIEEVDHRTIAPPKESTRVKETKGQPGVTVLTAEKERSSGIGLWAMLIGGGLVALLLIGGLVGAYALFNGSTATPPPTTAANVNTPPDEEATATARRATEIAIPTQTALAATTQAEQAIAKQTADAQLIAGALQARDATATAEAATIQAMNDAATAEANTAAAAESAAAETATAEAIANIPPTPTETPSPVPTDTPLPTLTFTPAPPTPTFTPAPPTDTPTPERPAISGKLAFPVDNGLGKYDVFIYSLPDGNQLGKIAGARQPDFRHDGAKLLINGEGGSFGENVFEANPTGNVERAVSGSPTDSHPVYNPDGGRIAYDNPQLAIGTDGNYHSYIFVQCSMLPPPQEGDGTCQDIARFGILVPDGQIGEIQGSNPVWASNDHIFYKGCNTWAGGGSCGVFTVASWANKRSSNGETPRKIIDGTSNIPTDTHGNWVAYHSSASGVWEAYVMDLSGANIINISNSPSSLDGLPTISPDGQWVAFASNRDGGWAVYVAPISGGAASKLFDFPKGNPWGAGGGREWQNERMSWGP